MKGRSFRSATVDRAGSMPAQLYSEATGIPPTDPTTPLPTTGSTGVFVDTTATNVASTLDPSITDLAYDMSWDTGHKASKILMPFLLIPGLAQSKAGISSTCRHRYAGYTDESAAYAPLPIAVTTRGRGNGGTQRYVRDTQDLFDLLAAAVTAAEAAGCTVYGGGRCAVIVGYSTGAFDLQLALARRPEGVLAGAELFPNFDIGYDADDGYRQLVSDTIRSTYLDTQIGARGQGSAAELDPYMARNAIDGLPRNLAMLGAPHLWVFGDETEAPLVPIPKPSRLSSALRAHPASAAKTHVWITTDADAVRVLHGRGLPGEDAGVDSTGAQLAERRFVRAALAAREWTMPRETPAGGLRVFGWMAAKEIANATDPADNRPGWEMWLGPNAGPRSDEAAGGTKHACEVRVFDAGKQFLIEPVTSADGYYEIRRDGDTRKGTIEAGGKRIVRMNEAPVISTLDEAGFTDVWHSDTVGAGTVSTWAASIGAKSWVSTLVASDPATATDGDGKQVVRFTASSSHRLKMASLLVDPTQDFTLAFVLNNRSATANKYLFELRHKGGTSAVSIWRSSGIRVSYLNASNANAFGTSNIEQPMTAAAKHWVVIQRRDDVVSLSVDGAVLIKATVTAGTFTTSTVETLIGCGLGNDGTTYYNHSDVDYYTIAAAQAVVARPMLDASWARMKTVWSF